MKTTMTRGELRVIADTDHVQCGDAATMANMLLAGMGSEPVVLPSHITKISDTTLNNILANDDETPMANVARMLVSEVKFWRSAQLYAAPPAPVAVPDRERVRGDHAKWSQETFGNVGPIGPLKHLSKEALEAASDPGDLSEWADMQFLLWDAQRRAGITDEQITAALEEKLKVNMARDWPEPKDGEPRLHIKSSSEQ